MARCLIAFTLFAVVMYGCTPKTVAPIVFTPGAELESIQSEVSLSYSSPWGSGGGRGYLVYQKPDRSHLVVLTPFGTTVMETFTNGNRLTIVIPSKETAYSGTFDEIPVRGGLQGWKAMRWMVEELPGSGMPDGEVDRVNREGKRETVWYNAAGLVVRKLTENGEEVVYRDYRSIDGVPFPSVIEYQDRRGTSLKISFDEPEINRPVAETALIPRLDGYSVLSIRRFGSM